VQLRTETPVATWRSKALTFLTGLAQTIGLGATLGVACGLVIVSFGWLLNHPTNQPFEVALPGIAKLALVSGAKAGTISFTISRYLFLHKARLTQALPALVAFTCVGGIGGYWFGGVVAAEILAVASFFLASFAICQRHDNRREGKYYEGW
jgi:hypothetical protein